MYLLLDRLCNKYFISNYYQSLSMISRREKIVCVTQFLNFFVCMMDWLPHFIKYTKDYLF